MSESDSSFAPPEDTNPPKKQDKKEKENKKEKKEKKSNKKGKVEESLPIEEVVENEPASNKKEKKLMKRKTEESSPLNETLKNEPVSAKKQKTSDEPTSINGPDGVKMFALGNERYVSRSTFKGVDYINIREFYKAGNDLKPSKKGISLTMEQFEAFKKIVDFV
uniref:PC4 domain-containing protein n=1 Tax=Parastrongyloides trichosuri TaxID=131310 RepID=A0A0N5A1N5_PARTI